MLKRNLMLASLLFATVLFMVPASGYCDSLQIEVKTSAVIESVNAIKQPYVEAVATTVGPGIIKIEGCATNNKAIADYLHTIEDNTGYKINLRSVLPSTSDGRRVSKFTVDIFLDQPKNVPQAPNIAIKEMPSEMAQNATQAEPFICLDSEGGGEDFYSTKFHWATSDARYDFDARGGIIRTVKSTIGLARKSNLPVPKNTYIVKIKVKPYREDLLIAYEISDSDSGSALICRFSEKPLKAKWCLDIDGFNAIAAVGTDGAAYVGSVGFLGRINLESGKYIWTQSNLYSRDPAFNLFEIPIEDESVVAFAAAGAIWIGKVITLDRKSGKILHIDSPSTMRRYRFPCETEK